jgi:hypothetical protein
MVWYCFVLIACSNDDGIALLCDVSRSGLHCHAAARLVDWVLKPVINVQRCVVTVVSHLGRKIGIEAAAAAFPFHCSTTLRSPPPSWLTCPVVRYQRACIQQQGMFQCTCSERMGPISNQTPCCHSTHSQSLPQGLSGGCSCLSSCAKQLSRMTMSQYLHRTIW